MVTCINNSLRKEFSKVAWLTAKSIASKIGAK